MQEQPIGLVRRCLGDDWLGEPRPGVRLTPSAQCVQLVDALTDDDRREKRFRRCDLDIATPLPLQVCLLDDVFGVHHAAEHAIGEGDQERPHTFERFGILGDNLGHQTPGWRSERKKNHCSPARLDPAVRLATTWPGWGIESTATTSFQPLCAWIANFCKKSMWAAPKASWRSQKPPSVTSWLA